MAGNSFLPPSTLRGSVEVRGQTEKLIRELQNASFRALANGLPTGMVAMFGASTAPSGWLICDGSAVSRTTYSALFAVIGTTFGVGDGSTTFNVPNFGQRFPVGATGSGEYGDGSAGGAASVTLTAAQMPSHTHSVDPPNTTTSSDGHNHTGTTSGQSVSHSHSGTTLTFPTGQTTGSTGHTHEGTGNDTFARSINQSSPSVGTGKIGGSTGNQSASHNHTFTTSADTHTHTVDIASFSSGGAGSGSSHENRPPFLAIRFIIKA